jgi:uncharacterized protein
MIGQYIDDEFIKMNNDILNNKEFNKMRDIAHHGINRYDHLVRVSYYSYKVAKFLRLNYKETARAGLLHDFFDEEISKDDNKVNQLRRHPKYAVDNAKKYFSLTDREEDIIKTHMFPVTFTPPKYLESWIDRKSVV